MISPSYFLHAHRESDRKGTDKRFYERVELVVPGKLFDPSTETEFTCRVMDLSPGGAGVLCASDFSENAALVLYVGEFGRFEGHVVRHSADAVEGQFRFGLRFNLAASKRERIASMLALFVLEGLQAITNMRAARRVRTNGNVELTLSDGSHLTCELIDISLDGVALRMAARPPIGERVQIGGTAAEVVRHHETGVAMRFLRRHP